MPCFLLFGGYPFNYCRFFFEKMNYEVMILDPAQVPYIWAFSSKSSRQLTRLDVQSEMLMMFGTILVSCSLLLHHVMVADLICFTLLTTESYNVASCFHVVCDVILIFP
jgi:hypothetical protein